MCLHIPRIRPSISRNSLHDGSDPLRSTASQYHALGDSVMLLSNAAVTQSPPSSLVMLALAMVAAATHVPNEPPSPSVTAPQYHPSAPTLRGLISTVYAPHGAAVPVWKRCATYCP